jgi:hypothetical protein
MHENEGGPSRRFWVGGVSEEREREGKGKSNKVSVMSATPALCGGAGVQTKLPWTAS